MAERGRRLLYQSCGENGHLDVGEQGYAPQQVGRLIRPAAESVHQDALGQLDQWLGGQDCP
jgi:hypothetical protein